MNDEKRIRVEPRCVTETARSSVKENPSSFMSMVDELIAGYRTCHDAWAVSQKTKAEGFNLLETMGVDEKELCHSRLLEWLMAWEIEQGTHAQGKLGFQLFLEETGLDSSYANAVYWVQREVAGKKSRIDIEIAANETFIIHIENKINAPEYKNETQREWEDLQERADGLRIACEARHAIFLTLDGSSPGAGEHFVSLTWSRIARLLEKFADRAESPEVALFARHYANALRRLSASQTIEEEN